VLSALIDGSGFVRIEPGEFLMGSEAGFDAERPPHRVRISARFEMGRFEVTQTQWDTVMRTAHRPSGQAQPAGPAAQVNPSHFKAAAGPVESVSWQEVQRFLLLMNARDPSHFYRLPTEAEWEYAAGAGQPERGEAALPELAWFATNALGQPHPIGGKRANAWGLHDMHGNVSEWVADWFAPDYYEQSPATDPKGPDTGSYRVYRGCSWLSPVEDCRQTRRGFNFPSDGYYNVGFRLVRTPR
jgi:formylglycine-generating enzyme required for sulfatase activity